MNDNPDYIEQVQQTPMIDDTFGFSAPEFNNMPNVLDEIVKILSYRSNLPILEFWATRGDDFPILKLLAQRFLCIPATSASSERAFSQVKLLDTRLRSRLDMEKISQMVMAKNWIKHEFPTYFE